MISIAAIAGTTLTVPTLKLPGTLDQMPQIGYGTWLSEAGEVYAGTKAALKCGYRHIDEAWVYMNEEEVGQAISEALAEGVCTRDELWLTTKLWQCHHRPELVREGCVDSMTKLGVEQLDLFLMHFPVSFQPGVVEATTQEMMDDVAIEDTWRAMEKLVDEGLVRNIGVSNFEIDELKRIQAVATKPVACNQFETHPYYQRNELVEYCAANGIAVTAHSSMGGQNNAMKAFHASPPLTDDATVARIAAKHATSPQLVLLAWGMQRPAAPTAIIPKSVTPARIESNLKGVLGVALDADDLAALAALDKPGLDFSFSGLKTAVYLLAQDEPDAQADIARAFEEAVVETLATKCARALEAAGCRDLLIAGGVAANTRLREALSALPGIRLHTPPLALCTDNGAMIAHAGALRLGDAIAAPTAMHARARWPLDTLAPPAGLTKPKHSTEHPWT